MADYPDFVVFAHVYYPETWAEIVRRVELIVQQPYGLVVTRPTGSSPVLRPQSPHLKFVAEMEVENRGRDILPFLSALSLKDVPPFEIGLKIHTKRSLHRRDGEAWRRFLISSLLRTEADGRLSGCRLLELEPRLGLVAPEAHLLPLGGRLALNDKLMVTTFQHLQNIRGSRAAQHVEHSAGNSKFESGRFPAGSMFWFRHSAFRNIIDADLSSIFARERGQLDGTAAHAFERMFALIVEQEGFVPAAMENFHAIADHGGPPFSLTELKKVINEGLEHDNPFVMPISDFWRRHPKLLNLAHRVYASLPQSSLRLLRKSMGRGW